jgi:predicted RNA methylase
MSLAGSTLAGGKGINERVLYDFYATPIPATLALIERETFTGKILELACGQGHIIQAVRLHNDPDCTIRGTDIVQREDVFGLGIKGGVDFLKAQYTPGEYNHVITNPPFAIAQEFIEKALMVATDKVAIFCKIQLLEGKGRKRLFELGKLKMVYVFRGRVNPLNNGKETDKKGKPWSSTMCFAWFVWDNSFVGCPSIGWI